MILFGYLLAAIIIFVFLRYPKWGVLAAIFSRPTIDMFWWAKSEGFISPLFIVGVVVPMLAIVGISKIQYRRYLVPVDKLILAYLGVFATLTAMKIVNAPQYAFNSIDSLSRIMSVTLFYFVGRAYFQTPGDIRLLMVAVLGSVVFPFVLTLGQGALGINLTHFSDVYAAAGPGVGSSDVSGYFMHGRHDLVRISGVYEGVYELAFMGAISGIIVYAFAATKGIKIKLWHLVLLFAGLFLLYFTYSRSAWVTTVVTFLLFFIIRGEYTKILVMIGVCLLMYLLIDNVQYRFEDELGFLAGSTDFDRVGYSRGGLWIRVFADFNGQGITERLIGNYGLGNPENQFLDALVWFGYIGFLCLLVLLATLTLKIFGWMRVVRNRRSPESNVLIMMGCFAISTYWFGGLGNNFLVQISTQWIIWTWVGALATGAAARRVARRSPANQTLAEQTS